MSKFSVTTWNAKHFPGAMCLAMLTSDDGKPLTVYGVWTARTKAEAEAAAKRDNFGHLGRGLDGRSAR